MTEIETAAATARAVELTIGGMTCASCAARIEKKFNKIVGVSATVNCAMESAKVSHADLVAAVEEVGHTAAPPAAPEARTAGEPDAPAQGAVDALRDRLTISAVVTARSWHWRCSRVSFRQLAVAVSHVDRACRRAGRPALNRAAVKNLRHASATMDTLMSMGVTAAFGWSLWALFVGDAGKPAMRMGFTLIPQPGSGTSEMYLEIVAALTVFILLGRCFEAHAKRRSGAALHALLEMGAKDVTVLRVTPDGETGHRIPIEQLGVGDRFVVRPGEKVARTASSSKALLRSIPLS